MNFIISTKLGKNIFKERIGNIARCIQHEIDHLNGVLYIDRMDEKFLINIESGREITIEEYVDI